ncbi:hypothetical protein [Singulisphaera sp. PoT]|uniref:hypothetical protein n=1 Tax=Singulisphaera sp. PoT TaxID=3411797 RepID=UPI003BF593B8
MFALIFAIMIVEVLITLGISRAFGIHLGSSVVAGMGLPNVIIAGVLADQIFKRMGLSRSGTTVEGRKPTTATPEGEAGDDEVVEIFYRRSFKRFRRGWPDEFWPDYAERAGLAIE